MHAQTLFEHLFYQVIAFCLRGAEVGSNISELTCVPGAIVVHSVSKNKILNPK